MSIFNHKSSEFSTGVIDSECREQWILLERLMTSPLPQITSPMYTRGIFFFENPGKKLFDLRNS